LKFAYAGGVGVQVSPAGELLFFLKKKCSQKKLSLAGGYSFATGRKFKSFQLPGFSKVALSKNRLSLSRSF